MTRFDCNVNRLLFLSVEAWSCTNVISTNTTLERQTEMEVQWLEDRQKVSANVEVTRSNSATELSS